jgi:hypothetical protein
MKEDSIHRTLRRLLANGPLTAMPRRPADAELLLRLASGRFDASRLYREDEVNQILEAWLATISAQYGIDHVSLRRYLVDMQFLLRDASGSTYKLNHARPVIRENVNPAEILAELQRERAARKRQHAA